MPYIDKDYYENVFMGKVISDEKEMDRTFVKASETVDILTNFRIQKDLNEYPQFIQTSVKRATAMMAEHYILNGGYDQVNSSGLQSVSIVSFSYSVDNSKSSINVPQDVYRVLSFSGLLYSGIDVGGHIC